MQWQWLFRLRVNSSWNKIFLLKSSTALKFYTLKFYLDPIEEFLIPFPDPSFPLKHVPPAKSLLSLSSRFKGTLGLSCLMDTSPYTGVVVGFSLEISVTLPKWTSKRMAGILFRSDPLLWISSRSEISVRGDTCRQKLSFLLRFQLLHEMEEEHQLLNVWKKDFHRVWNHYHTITAFRQKARINFYCQLRVFKLFDITACMADS